MWIPGFSRLQRFVTSSLHTCASSFQNPTRVMQSLPHFGDPMCYNCCGIHCCIELIAVLAIVLVCCAYGTDGTCCDYCYWPF